MDVQSRVFVLSNTLKPLMPCHPARARELLCKGKAAVYRMHPFTIILKYRSDGNTQPTLLKVDPGSKGTGLAIVSQFLHKGWTKIVGINLKSRVDSIRQSLLSRKGYRRLRRSKLRYRPKRFNNRTRHKDWLPPSMSHLVAIHDTQVRRLTKLCPLDRASLEVAQFDTQLLQGNIKSKDDYQSGPLRDTCIRDYLFSRYNGHCVYCNRDSKTVRMTKDHVVPRSKGGSDRVSNLVLCCIDCNQSKGNMSIREYLKDSPILLRRILDGLKTPLQGATQVSLLSSRLELITSRYLPTYELSYGYVTRYNRRTQGYPKDHCIDAACIGYNGSNVRIDTPFKPLVIQSTGHGERQRVRNDSNGFPKGHKTRKKYYYGFQTGDIVKVVKNGISHVGRVACRASGYFDITTRSSKINNHYKNCTVIHRNDGYSYSH